MSFIPRPHEIYKHFKGNLYQIVAVAEHSETGEQLVIYQALYGDFKTYARPLAMFTDRVDQEKYPGVRQEFRFELQGAESGRQMKDSERPGSTRPNAGPAGTEHRAGPDGRAQGLGPERARTEYKAGPERARTEYKAGPERAHTEYRAEPESPGPEEFRIDPMVLEFLDSDSYQQKLNILAGLHHRITDDMITTLAVACDIEVEDGDIETRFDSLRNCLLTMERYECNRLG